MITRIAAKTEEGGEDKLWRIQYQAFHRQAGPARALIGILEAGMRDDGIDNGTTPGAYPSGRDIDCPIRILSIKGLGKFFEKLDGPV